ncbi:MAG: acyl carrier protein [Akkermansia sp.]|nr:acyl carrier protein [Akkermansia sp.]
MTSEEFLAEIKEALELDDLDIKMDDNFREYEEWDSLTFLTLMTLMNENHGVALDIDTFNGISTWRDLYQLL